MKFRSLHVDITQYVSDSCNNRILARSPNKAFLGTSRAQLTEVLFNKRIFVPYFAEKTQKFSFAIFSFFCSSFSPKSDQHPAINPQYIFNSPATLPASYFGQLWSHNSPIMNKRFQLSFSLWFPCWHRTLKLSTKVSLHLVALLLSLSGPQNCWYRCNPWRTAHSFSGCTEAF
jgi:hypothetical protein